LPSLEADLCARANLVITTSETLCQDRIGYNPHTYWIPNGADIGHFARPVEPAPELLRFPGPRVGFVGGLSQWVDVPLIAYLAAHRPSWSIVLIGPVGIDLSALSGLPNVHVLGPRPYADVPAYLAAMDVGLIPFRAEPVTYHADPIKAYEYLAAGLPVVATDLPALRRLEHVLRLADTPAAFLAQVDAAVAEGRAARAKERQAEASRHGWSDRFGQIERLIEASCPR
jgi:glycosyltransferase involved in cell wall biosynthesis